MSDAKILEQFLQPERIERMDSVLEKRTENLTLVLDRLHHQHNIAAVLRSADAFGIQTIYFSGKRFSHSEGISLGAERWLNVKSYEDEAELITTLKEDGYKLVVLEPKEYAGDLPCLPVHQLPFQEKLALIFGNEKEGVSAGLKSAAEISSHIEMYGFVESFNISVAAAICLYSARMKIEGESNLLKNIPEERKEVIRNNWLTKDVRAGDKVLEELKKRK